MILSFLRRHACCVMAYGVVANLTSVWVDIVWGPIAAYTVLWTTGWAAMGFALGAVGRRR